MHEKFKHRVPKWVRIDHEVTPIGNDLYICIIVSFFETTTTTTTSLKPCKKKLINKKKKTYGLP